MTGPTAMGPTRHGRAVRDVVWLGVSNGKVLDYWTSVRREGTRVRRASEADRAFPVTTLQVHRGIWERALAAADGDAKRIRVYSPTRVEVTLT